MKRMFLSFTALLLSALLLTGLAEPVFAEAAAPVAENLELRTYRGVSVSGRLTAYDPKGQELRYEITTQPQKGSLKLEEDGSFIYTPLEKKRGRDYFGYKAVDEAGNYSQEASVLIRIEKQKTATFYADMAGRGEEYAALRLSEAGLLTGEKIGESFCFYPEREMSRGEFISLCMLISPEPLLSSAMKTGYEDDAVIPAWQKSFAYSAELSGVDRGRATESGRSFMPEESLSSLEAAEILNRALGIEDVNYTESDNNQAQACMNLSARGIGGDFSSQSLSRAEAARLLAAALDFLSGR